MTYLRFGLRDLLWAMALPAMGLGVKTNRHRYTALFDDEDESDG